MNTGINAEAFTKFKELVQAGILAKFYFFSDEPEAYVFFEDGSKFYYTRNPMTNWDVDTFEFADMEIVPTLELTEDVQAKSKGLLSLMEEKYDENIPHAEERAVDQALEELEQGKECDSMGIAYEVDESTNPSNGWIYPGY